MSPHPLSASTAEDMQRMTDIFAQACANIGLIISIIKADVMFQPSPCEPYVEPHITINGQRLKVTDSFPIGSVMSNSGAMDDEINPRGCQS